MSGRFWGKAQDERGVFSLGGVVRQPRQRNRFGAMLQQRAQQRAEDLSMERSPARRGERALYRLARQFMTEGDGVALQAQDASGQTFVQGSSGISG